MIFMQNVTFPSLSFWFYSAQSHFYYYIPIAVTASLFSVFCFAGESQPVSGPQRVQTAAYPGLQLPGGRRSHQPSHDSGHVSHEKTQRGLTTATTVRV